LTIDPRQIVDFLRNEARRPLRPKELAAALGVPAGAFADFRDQLERLEADGVLYRVQRQRYAAPERINLQVGRLQTTRSGAGFLIPEDGTPDVFVPVEGLNTAIHGDRVVVRVEGHGRGDRPQGRVIRVVERARDSVVGVFHAVGAGHARRRSSHGFIVPEDRKLPWDVFVAPGAGGAAVDGDVVVVRITDWGSAHRGPTGEVEEVLGRAGDPGVDVLSIIRAHALPTTFPTAVEKAAAALRAARAGGVSPAELERREDLRGAVVFTIDPADARDHDDALSIEGLPQGGWRVGIHIADVSHYVGEGDELDEEAFRRGTSVYLVDRVVPMLPHALSSDLCSLLPDADRLTLSLLVDVAGNGAVRASRLVRAVIRSRHRLAYETAQEVLDGTASVDPEADQAIRMLAQVAAVLRARRYERGSIDFDLPETRVLLGAAGEPTDIQRVVRLEAHRLVEDMMLLANEVIAQRAASAGVGFMFRIHEPPDEARMARLRDFLAGFGHRLRGHSGSPAPRDLQRVVQAVEGRPEEALVSTVVLRSMKQARYGARNLGHFGLATATYTHFTSPIRRYPDLVVHRLAAALFIDGREPWLGEERLEDVARHASERERVAVDAERDSKDLKKTEFMERHLGSEFDGTVASVTAFGFFVLLDVFFVEGLVHVSSLEDDYYVFAEEQYALVGERTGRRFRTGDRVRIRVSAVDREERRITFDLVQELGAAGEQQRAGARAGRTGGTGGGVGRGSGRRGGGKGAKPGMGGTRAGGGKGGRAGTGKRGGSSGGKGAGDARGGPAAGPR
jgi:ribonuclease R